MRSDDVYTIGTVTGNIDAIIVRSVVDSECQETRSEVENILSRAVDAVEANKIANHWKEMGDVDSLDKACRKYCTKMRMVLNKPLSNVMRMAYIRLAKKSALA